MDMKREAQKDTGARVPDPAPCSLPALSNGQGPPLVMLGGGITGASAFAAHAPILGCDFHVIRIQSLNVGRALSRQPLPAGYSIKLESAAVARTLDALGLSTPVYLVGHSMGALVALDFALDRPDRVRALVLSEPPAFWAVPSDDPQLGAAMRQKREFSQRLGPESEPTDDQLVDFLRWLGVSDPRPPAPRSPERDTWLARRASLRGLRAVAEHGDDLARLERFERPVLLFTAESTIPFHRRVNDILAARLPRIERAALPGGHSAAVDQHVLFSAMVRAFLLRH